ncbi:MAG TPA: hypothetical protein VIG24_08240 [Acidimicrobiia bacterium]
MKNVVIFAIDNAHSLHQQAKFLRHLDTLRAMGKLDAEPKFCIGFWEGQLERSYIMPIDDYLLYVAAQGWVDNQYSVVRVDAYDNADLMWPRLDVRMSNIGRMHKVSADVARKLDAWTFVEEEGQYYAA